ncbi:MAG: C40 family peptidase [Hyphomicrobiales bacterium]|nr:C40 family peptidase [Hyphomicrobiales bacterium]
MRRAQIVAAARGWIGTPYRHQASLKGVGCDCLGLVRGVWRETVGPEPEPLRAYSPHWAEAGGQETLRDLAQKYFKSVAPAELAPGDLLLFRFRAHLCAKHVAIVGESDTMIHAHDGACVAEVALAPWWRRRLVSAYLFPPAGSR